MDPFLIFLEVPFLSPQKLYLRVSFRNIKVTGALLMILTFSCC